MTYACEYGGGGSIIPVYYYRRARVFRCIIAPPPHQRCTCTISPQQESGGGGYTFTPGTILPGKLRCDCCHTRASSIATVALLGNSATNPSWSYMYWI